MTLAATPLSPGRSTLSSLSRGMEDMETCRLANSPLISRYVHFINEMIFLSVLVILYFTVGTQSIS